MHPAPGLESSQERADGGGGAGLAGWPAATRAAQQHLPFGSLETDGSSTSTFMGLVAAPTGYQTPAPVAALGLGTPRVKMEGQPGVAAPGVGPYSDTKGALDAAGAVEQGQELSAWLTMRGIGLEALDSAKHILLQGRPQNLQNLQQPGQGNPVASPSSSVDAGSRQLQQQQQQQQQQQPEGAGVAPHCASSGSGAQQLMQQRSSSQLQASTDSSSRLQHLQVQVQHSQQAVAAGAAGVAGVASNSPAGNGSNSAGLGEEDEGDDFSSNGEGNEDSDAEQGHPGGSFGAHNGGGGGGGGGIGAPNNRSGGGAGKRLRFRDLQSQFGTGLKEAAVNLGICATTLKRACRRHGIRRWPRRQIAK